MKNLKNYLLPLFVLTLLFTACEKDAEIDTINTDLDKPEIEQIVTNPVLARSSGQSGDGLDFECFIVLYPFGLVDENGILYEITDEAALNVLNDDQLIIVDFDYPLNVEQDSVLSSVNSGEELAELFAGCIPYGGWEEGFFPAYLISSDNSCYELVYPVSLVSWDGETVVVNDESEFNTALATEPYNFIFPFNLLDEVGSVTTVDNIDDLFNALFECNGFEVGDSISPWNYENGFEYISCYIVEFPMDLLLDGGITVTVNNHEELCEYMFQGSILDYVYPLTLIDEDGNTVIADDQDHLNELLEECWDIDWGGGFQDLFLLTIGALGNNPENIDPCFNVSYPVSIVDFDGNATDLNSDEELQVLLQSGEISRYFLQFPISVVLVSDGTEVTLEDSEDLLELINNCF